MHKEYLAYQFIVVTLGFYYPWAMSKIGSYVIGKTAMIYSPVLYAIDSHSEDLDLSHPSQLDDLPQEVH